MVGFTLLVGFPLKRDCFSYDCYHCYRCYFSVALLLIATVLPLLPLLLEGIDARI